MKLLRDFRAMGANREFLESVLGRNALPLLEGMLAQQDEKAASAKTIEQPCRTAAGRGAAGGLFTPPALLMTVILPLR